MAYVVVRNEDGVVEGVQSGNTFHPKHPKNSGWRKFLEWNAKQTPPLDVSDIFNLDGYKLRRIEAIRAQSSALDQAGFTHGTKTFVLDTDLMLHLLLLFARRGNAGTFPAKIPTKFGRTLTLADTAAFDSFCIALVAKHRAVHERGAELIEAITLAADKAAVDAVVDDRT